jgi:hypothetical protein
MASVRKQIIPTERPPLVSEVSANFLWRKEHKILQNNYGYVNATIIFLCISS